MLKDQLKIELKEWEHSFIKVHGRDPNKDDIKKLPEIRNMYKRYARLRKDQSTVAPEVIPPKPPPSSESTLLELGPTPQIYGKAMSIFDMRVSPIKTASVAVSGNTEEALVESHSTDDEDQLSACEDMPQVKRQLAFTSPTPISSPKKEPDSERKACGPNSPLKWGKDNIQISIRTVSPLKRTPVKGPNHTSMSFSPSPLVKRPLTRSLLELMKEHEAIVEEFKQIEGTEEDETLLSSTTPDNIFAQEDEIVVEGDRKTIKTKRRRVLRRKAIEVEDGTVQKTIADEITKLKKQRINAFMGVDSSTEETNESTTTSGKDQEPVKKPTPKVVKKRSKKYNLVSNNFKRLKLPTKKGRRWNNRRR